MRDEIEEKKLFFKRNKMKSEIALYILTAP